MLLMKLKSTFELGSVLTAVNLNPTLIFILNEIGDEISGFPIPISCQKLERFNTLVPIWFKRQQQVTEGETLLQGRALLGDRVGFVENK